MFSQTWIGTQQGHSSFCNSTPPHPEYEWTAALLGLGNIKVGKTISQHHTDHLAARLVQNQSLLNLKVHFHEQFCSFCLPATLYLFIVSQNKWFQMCGERC